MQSSRLVFGKRLVILISRYTVSVDYAVSDSIAPLSTFIARVTLYGINSTVLAFLCNAHMVDCSVSVPVKKDDAACLRLIVPVLPLPVALKPVHTVRTER